MKSLLYKSFGLVYRITNWLKWRFTPGGLFVLAGLLTSAVVGLDTNQTLAYQIFTLLLAFLILSIAWCLFFRAGFSVSRDLPRFGTTGEPIPYRIFIKNLSKRSQTGLQIEEQTENPLPTFNEIIKSGKDDVTEHNLFDRFVGYIRWRRLAYRKRKLFVTRYSLPPVMPNEEEELRAEIVPLRRGSLVLKGLSISCTDPFGLVRSFIHVPVRQSFFVLPKRYDVPSLQLPGTRKFHSGGLALASSVGDSEEFMSMRDYRPGDPLRKIHWKSWAKTDRPIVKEYQDEFFVRHALILDTFQGVEYGEAFEEAVSVAASFACSIQTQESLLDLMFVGTEAYCFTSGRGISYTDRMLEILSAVRPCTDKPFSELPPMVFERMALLSGCICIFLSWNEERKAFIRKIESMGVPLIVLVVSEDPIPQPIGMDSEGWQPEYFMNLLTGRIEEGLAQL
ncbi:DUF58 domain-containing protein [Thermodesulfobacteriota bacterium]